ncbi:unnamed protein product [Moneuplotes crassus]|uniref:Uncharacterized protein n=2 Tax=Euplotes crassus TaxID=5936 RepID=A0AAD1XXV3_EUPCR|nr:unnamed protein product [Moneuplotes crassus]
MTLKAIFGAFLLFTSVVMAVNYEPVFELKKPGAQSTLTFLKGDQDGFVGVSVDHAKSSVNHLDSIVGVCYETQGDSQNTPVEGSLAFGFESVCMAYYTVEMACLEGQTSGSVKFLNSTVEERDGTLFWIGNKDNFYEYQIPAEDFERKFPDITTHYDLSSIFKSTGLPHFQSSQSFRCFLGGTFNELSPLYRDVDLSKYHEFSITTGSTSPSLFLKH